MLAWRSSVAPLESTTTGSDRQVDSVANAGRGIPELTMSAPMHTGTGTIRRRLRANTPTTYYSPWTMCASGPLSICTIGTPGDCRQRRKSGRERGRKSLAVDAVGPPRYVAAVPRP
jgi:hypothetical protein